MFELNQEELGYLKAIRDLNDEQVGIRQITIW